MAAVLSRAQIEVTGNLDGLDIMGGAHVHERFELEYPDGKRQPVMVDSEQDEYDPSNPRFRYGNLGEWTATVTSLDGEPIDFGARAFGPVVGDSHMWPLWRADGVVRKVLLYPIPSEPHAARVHRSAPLV